MSDIFGLRTALTCKSHTEDPEGKEQGTWRFVVADLQK